MRCVSCVVPVCLVWRCERLCGLLRVSGCGYPVGCVEDVREALGVV